MDFWERDIEVGQRRERPSIRLRRKPTITLPSSPRPLPVASDAHLLIPRPGPTFHHQQPYSYPPREGRFWPTRYRLSLQLTTSHLQDQLPGWGVQMRVCGC